MKRIKYLDGVKGLAAFMIMFGHICGVYKYSSQLSLIGGASAHILKNYIPFEFLHETNWLCVFLVISGFVAAFKEFDNVKQIIKAVVLRFARLYLLMMFAGVIIYTIYLAVGFHDDSLLKFFDSSFLSNRYNYQLVFADIFIQPRFSLVCNSYKLSDPYWMIYSLFYGAVGIYIYKYLSKNVIKTAAGRALCFAVITFAGWLVMDFLFLGVMLGLVLNILITEKPVVSDTANVVFNIMAAGSALALCGFHDAAYYFIMRFIPLPAFLAPNSNYKCIYVFFLLYAWSKMPKVQKFFENKIFLSLYRLSFGIYSLHWPVMCSVGSLVMLYMLGRYSFGVSLFAFGIAVMVSTLVLSVAYHFTGEKAAAILTDKLKKLL